MSGWNGKRKIQQTCSCVKTPLTGERMGLWLCLRQDWHSGDNSTGYSGQRNLAVSPNSLCCSSCRAHRPHQVGSCELPAVLLLQTSHRTPGAGSSLGSACACPFQHSRSCSGCQSSLVLTYNQDSVLIVLHGRSACDLWLRGLPNRHRTVSQERKHLTSKGKLRGELKENTQQLFNVPPGFWSFSFVFLNFSPQTRELQTFSLNKLRHFHIISLFQELKP